MSMMLMEACSLAAEEGFEPGQQAWADGVRKLYDRKAKTDAVLAFLNNFPADSHATFLDATMLVLKGSGTSGAAQWMQKLNDDVHVTVNDLVDELS
jgi:hypothetical protein